jgi:hypothetical protein
LKGPEKWKGLQKRGEPKDMSGCAESVFVDCHVLERTPQSAEMAISLWEQF